jgi:hypothetical protein
VTEVWAISGVPQGIETRPSNWDTKASAHALTDPTAGASTTIARSPLANAGSHVFIENTEKKPLRIFTHVSENDFRAKDPGESYHNWVMADERTAACRKAKGYDYRFVFSGPQGTARRKCSNKRWRIYLSGCCVATMRSDF